MSNHPHIRSIASRQFPRLERLERRLPPGDALLGLLAVWPNSTPVIEAEYATVEKPDFEIEETVTDTVSDAEMSVIRSEVSVPRPEIRRADNNSALAPQDPIYGFAHTSNAITHVSNPLRIEQSVGAELGGLTPAVQGMTNPSLARGPAFPLVLKANWPLLQFPEITTAAQSIQRNGTARCPSPSRKMSGNWTHVSTS